MATVKLYFDTRRKKSDETYPLKLKIFHRDLARYIPLNYSFKKNQWKLKDHRVNSSYPNAGRVNASIRKLVYQATTFLVENENEIKALSIDELKRRIQEVLRGNIHTHGEEQYGEVDLLQYGKGLVEQLRKTGRFGTADSYQDTINSIGGFLKGNDIDLTRVNYKFLRQYEEYCQIRGLRINSIGVYLRTLRAILNKAINEGIISRDYYPFQRFKIKREITGKRAISKREIKQIINLKLPENSRIKDSQNYFVFMFQMRGMNFIDLAYLKKSNLQQDRLIYRRAKTGKLYNLRLTDLAQKIILYYTQKNRKQEDYIFPILPKEVWGKKELERERFKSRRRYFNKDLKKIAALAEIDVNLTSYVSRHTWASIAKFSGVAPAIIGESLGHSDLRTTETYLANFDHNVLDEANELIVS